MKRTQLKKIFSDYEKLGGAEVTVCGWAKTVRDSKTFGFIELNDGSYFKLRRSSEAKRRRVHKSYGQSSSYARK